MSELQKVLMKRDGLSAEEANDLIELAVDDFNERLATGDMCPDICAEWFGLEEDYIEDLIG